MKIRHKLILGYLVIALLIWVVGYISVDISQKALQESIGESSVSLAVKVLDEIDRAVYNRIEGFQICSKDVMVREVVKNSNQEFEKLDDIQNYINKKEAEWTSAPEEEITPFMQKLMNNKLSKELKEKIEFHEEKCGYKVLGEIFITNKYGVNAAQTGKTSDYYQADEDWWQNAKKDGFYVEDVEYDESADVYSTAIGVRIDSEGGNFIGVIKAVLNIEEIINIMKKIEAAVEYDTTEFKLITKKGKNIYSTEDFEFFEDVSDELLSAFEQEREHAEYFIAEGDKPGEGQELFAHAHSKGHGDYRGLGWTLIVEHKTEEIFAPVAGLKNILLIISFIVTTFAVLIGLFISRSISIPIIKLKTAAAEIGKGKLDTKIEITSNDEVGQLAASFRKMTGDLKETTTSIDNLNAANQQLQAREQQLRDTNEQLQAKEQQLKVSNQQLQANEEQLRMKMNDLERFNRLAVGREQRMIELKQQVNALLRELAREEEYKNVPEITKGGSDGNGREK